MLEKLYENALYFQGDATLSASRGYFCGAKMGIQKIFDFLWWCDFVAGGVVEVVIMDEEFFERLKKKILPYFEEGDGHCFSHTERVYNLALKISEGEDVDMEVVRAAALLHDVARHKEKMCTVPVGSVGVICHAEEGARMADKILREMGFPEKKIGKVVHVIAVHRYSKGLKAESREAEILQDADRLDALGAVIIVRMAQATVNWNVPVYDKSIPIKERYDGSKSSMVNHIYEKILKLEPESFHTSKAREIARGRYDFVKEFVERYVDEVEGKR